MASAVTSIYNNIISAASAGFAPTNSADVSAIASSYQVVSATATQLYAGTAYITEINGSLVSASRAGNAANASLANSAWYDGTGRLISALADSATVSAIASAYAESAASSKLDSTASSSFYPADNPSGFISSVDLSDYATTAYVDSSVSSKLDATASSQFLTSIPSDYATTAYVDSSISGFAYKSAVSGWTAKQDALIFGYDGSNNISSIDGSAIGGQGGLDSATCSAIASAYAESAASAKQDTLTFGYDGTSISSIDGSSIAGAGGGVDSATCSAIASAYAESAVSSVSSSYYPATSNPSGYALSSDVSATVDIVGTSSSVWNTVTSKMESSAVQTAYASASAEYATAQGVLYILLPDGEDEIDFED